MIKYNQSALNNKSECFLLKQMIKTLRLNQGYKDKQSYFTSYPKSY